MINHLHGRFHQPRKGWDPVPAEHARQYADGECRDFNGAIFDKLEECVNGLNGNRVLDLGGGPDQHSVAFAGRGASVTRHDISRSNMRIAQERFVKVRAAWQ